MLYWYDAAALLLSVLAGLGVGSGGIFLVLLSSFTSLPPEEAVLCNLYFFIAALLASSVIHLRNGRLNLRFLFHILLLGLPGVWLGKYLRSFFSPPLLRIVLGLFLILSGILSLTIKKTPKNRKDKGVHS